MRRAVLGDASTLVGVVGAAFTRERGGVSLVRNRRSRAAVTWLGEASAILTGEAFISPAHDVVLHVGRRGGWYSFREKTTTIGLVFATFLPSAVLGGIVALLTTSIFVGGIVALIGVVLTYAVLVIGLIVAMRQRDPNGPSTREEKYREGLPSRYWLLSTLAAADGRVATAVPAVRTWLQGALPVDATAVAVAGNADVRRLYGALGFLPLEGSQWVLSRPVTLTKKDLKDRRDDAKARWPSKHSAANPG